MAKVNSVHTLHQSGHSNREIARLLGIDRATVGKYVHELQNQPNAPSGETPQEREGSPHRSGPISGCQPFLQIIEAKLDQGLSARRIHQDLVSDHDFSGSYYSVRRFVARLETKTELPFRRIETLPGEEAQIDFGTGAVVVDENGKQRRPWMFRIVLSHCRKGYSEVVWRQTTDNFIAAIENTFRASASRYSRDR